MAKSIDNLKKFAIIMRWLDNIRWNQESLAINKNQLLFKGSHSQGYYKKKMEVWNEKQKAQFNILIHWLCYITDRQTPTDIIWTKGVDAFAGLIDVFDSNEDLSIILKEKIGEIAPKKTKKTKGRQDKASDDNKDSKMHKLNCGYQENGEEVGFTPRFSLDKYLVIRTLCLLKEYGLNLAQFMREVYKKLSGVSLINGSSEADFIAKISFAGYLLSYNNSHKYDIENGDMFFDQTKDKDSIYCLNDMSDDLINKIRNYKNWLNSIINDKNKFEQAWKKWKLIELKRKGKGGRKEKPGDMYFQKRLWCALRDNIRYKKQFEDFKNAWGNNFSFESPKLMPYLEITADIWNERFRKNCLLTLAKEILAKNNLEDINALHLRNLYNKLWDCTALKEEEYYPMQTDVAFDFAPRMCNRSKTNPDICSNLCPFGEFTERLKLCIGDEKYKCPLALFACGYIKNCIPNECPIKNDNLWRKEDMSICKGRQN